MRVPAVLNRSKMPGAALGLSRESMLCSLIDRRLRQSHVCGKRMVVPIE